MSRFWSLILLLLPIACAPSPSIDRAQTFSQVSTEQPVLVLPVTSIMCPQDVGETFFDTLVDRLNTQGRVHNLKFVILKQDPETLPENALQNRTYATGEIFGCLEDVGCCSGEITFTIRLDLFQPGSQEPVLRMRYPVERFFDLEAASPEMARVKLARETAAQAASDLIRALSQTN